MMRARRIHALRSMAAPVSAIIIAWGCAPSAENGSADESRVNAASPKKRCGKGQTAFCKSRARKRSSSETRDRRAAAFAGKTPLRRKRASFDN